MKARFHPDARAEFVDAIVYIEDRRRGYGLKFEAELSATLERALQFPGSGARVPGTAEALDLRAFPLLGFPYSLMVAFESDEAVVFAVAHQHRKPGYWHGRLA
jgi:plasmid stabilization system protein ParE